MELLAIAKPASRSSSGTQYRRPRARCAGARIPQNNGYRSSPACSSIRVEPQRRLSSSQRRAQRDSRVGGAYRRYVKRPYINALGAVGWCATCPPQICPARPTEIRASDTCAIHVGIAQVGPP